jgi:hypothetical protein
MRCPHSARPRLVCPTPCPWARLHQWTAGAALARCPSQPQGPGWDLGLALRCVPSTSPGSWLRSWLVLGRSSACQCNHACLQAVCHFMRLTSYSTRLSTAFRSCTQLHSCLTRTPGNCGEREVGGVGFFQADAALSGGRGPEPGGVQLHPVAQLLHQHARQLRGERGAGCGPPFSSAQPPGHAMEASDGIHQGVGDHGAKSAKFLWFGPIPADSAL